jgi:hypothetical protein
MKKWSVNAAVHGSKHLGVYEAATAEEAERMAEKHASVNLCHQCADEVIDPEIVELIVDPVDDAQP